MERYACHIIFCDRRARDNVLIGRESLASKDFTRNTPQQLLDAPEEVTENIKTILTAFPEVFVCHSGIACSNRIRELQESRQEGIPIVVFLDVDPDVDFGSRLSRDSALLKQNLESFEDPDEYYGLKLLSHIASEAHNDSFGILVVPVVVVRGGQRLSLQVAEDEFYTAKLSETLQANVEASNSFQLVDPRILLRCLDAGATDAFNSPLNTDRLQQIIVAAYKAHLHYVKGTPRQLDLKRMRKRSWVGVEEERPYAYLREAMVSSLMSSICRPESAALGFDNITEAYHVNDSRKANVAAAIGRWDFSAHDFSDDELLYGAFLVFSHCLQVPELKQWQISELELQRFLLASRAAYNSFVLYHNFRHVIDVLQALFYSLLQIGALPIYPSTQNLEWNQAKSPISRLVKPFDALVLLVSAVGHDVGHPGVNNAFLVTLKAPLAQLYNDKSVLEAFHCAAYSQILRRHWKVVYEDVEFRRLLINTILATDMGIHSEYMANLGNLQDKLHHDGGTDSWTPKLTQSNKDLVLGLLIKCADVSNVARSFNIASKWAQILQLEFAKQGEMERDIGVASTLFGGPPEIGNMTKLANSQIGFMNFFGLPLFEGVTDVMPELHYAVDEISRNKAIWEVKIEQEKRKAAISLDKQKYRTEGTQSPRSASPQRASFLTSPDAINSGKLPNSIVPTKVSDQEDRHTLSMKAVESNSFSPLDGRDVFFTPPVSPDVQQAGESRTSDFAQSAFQSSGRSMFSSGAASSLDGQHIISSRTRQDTTKSEVNDDSVNSEQRVIHTHSTNGSQNFSRPYSQQPPHQATCSVNRSSASRAPTSSSANYPTSPTETQATSVAEDNESASPIINSKPADRPQTSNSMTEILNATSNIPSRGSRASVSAVSESKAEKAHGRRRPVTSDMANRGYGQEKFARDHGSIKQVKRKSSRWKFDFWRRKNRGDRDVLSLGSNEAMP